MYLLYKWNPGARAQGGKQCRCIGVFTSPIFVCFFGVFPVGFWGGPGPPFPYKNRSKFLSFFSSIFGCLLNAKTTPKWSPEAGQNHTKK